jgi:hypothetical protein
MTPADLDRALADGEEIRFALAETMKKASDA